MGTSAAPASAGAKVAADFILLAAAVNLARLGALGLARRDGSPAASTS